MKYEKIKLIIKQHYIVRVSHELYTTSYYLGKDPLRFLQSEMKICQIERAECDC